MTWGRARNLVGVHWFDTSGNSLCNSANGNHLRLRYPRPNWDPEHEETCSRCLAELKDRAVLVQLRSQQLF